MGVGATEVSQCRELNSHLPEQEVHMSRVENSFDCKITQKYGVKYQKKDLKEMKGAASQEQ